MEAKMGRKYDIYDEHGKKIGTAERVPSAGEQAAGLILFVYLFWKPLLILAVIFGIIGGVSVLISSVSDLSKYGTTDRGAIATIESQRQKDALIARLRQLGTIRVNKTGQGGYRVDYVEFKDGQIIVYFESPASVEERACISWYDFESGRYLDLPPLQKHVAVVGDQVKGYMSFPDSIITPRTHFLFSYRCGIWSSIELWNRDFAYSP
jgi:hypothetical protein